MPKLCRQIRRVNTTIKQQKPLWSTFNTLQSPLGPFEANIRFGKEGLKKNPDKTNLLWSPPCHSSGGWPARHSIQLIIDPAAVASSIYSVHNIRTQEHVSLLLEAGKKSEIKLLPFPRLLNPSWMVVHLIANLGAFFCRNYCVNFNVLLVDGRKRRMVRVRGRPPKSAFEFKFIQMWWRRRRQQSLSTSLHQVRIELVEGG